MKWIKDFIYDHNDLLVALIIILIGATVIYGRMNLILDYPAKVSAMSEEAGNAVSGNVDDPNAGQTNPGGDNPGGQTTPGGDTPGGNDDPNGQTTPGVDDPNGQTTPGGDDDPNGQTTYEYVDFKVADGQYKSWEQLAKGMEEQGIIDSYKPLYNRVLDRVNIDGIESYTFYVGTYRLPKGADVDTLIDIIRVYPTGD